MVYYHYIPVGLNLDTGETIVARTPLFEEPHGSAKETRFAHGRVRYHEKTYHRAATCPSHSIAVEICKILNGEA